MRDVKGRPIDDMAIRRLQDYAELAGRDVWVAFSGGKDSVVLLDIAHRSGIDFSLHYNLTTVDPPELVKFVKTFPNVIIERPAKTMWQLIKEKGMPSRWRRWCCQELKESNGDGYLVVTGVRWAESARRKEKWSLYQVCHQRSTFILNPLIDWTDLDIWQYIAEYRLRVCHLYYEGLTRLGCVLCPMVGPEQVQFDLKRWPKLCGAWKRAAYRCWERNEKLQEKNATAEDFWQWWLKAGRSK